MSRLFNVRVRMGQTDRQTHTTERITMPHSQMVIIMTYLSVLALTPSEIFVSLCALCMSSSAAQVRDYWLHIQGG